MRRIFGAILALLLAMAPAMASDVTGTIQTATGTPVKNGTLTMTLNQAGISPGSFTVVSSPVECFTSTDGAVKGLSNPVAAPSAVANTASGSVAAGTYYVKITYVTIVAMAEDTETLASPATTVTLGATGKIDVTAPASPPAGADGYQVYVGTTAGSETLQALVQDFSNTSITSYSVGSALPASNDSVCSVVFNDAIIPSFTYYRVGLTDVNGRNVPGFPMNWYLSGSSVDVSAQYPLAATTQQTRFPTPVLANPSSNAQQSVASPLTLNGYTLTAGAAIFSANAAPPSCLADEAVIYADDTGALTLCDDGNLVGDVTAWHDSNTDSLIGDQLLIGDRTLSDPASGSYMQLYLDGTGHILAYDFDSSAYVPISIDGQINGTEGTNTASANNLDLPGDSNVVPITGTVQINCINASTVTGGTRITLTFTTSVTVANNQSCSGNYKPLRLNGAANLSATDLDVLDLIYVSGTSEWHEASRSVN